ncbi:Uncharacterised protein [uncultured archaeon]|nr:Uncharacterised protein [uncultured archaeon]
MAKPPFDYTLIAVVLILAAAVLLAITYMVPRPGGERTISVTGTASMTVQPDEAVVYVQAVTRSNDSAEEAKSLNAEVSDAVLTSLLKAGVDRGDIETQGFSVYPEYDYLQDRGQVLKGYVATNSMKVTAKDFDDVGKIVDVSVDSGALISYINYELSAAKTNEYKALVLADASKDARNKAEAIVAGLGKSLGDLVSVSASNYNYMPYAVYDERATGSAPSADVKQIATDLPPANVDVSATVQVTYQVA